MERLLQKPFTDIKRIGNIRNSLIEAYADGDKGRIKNAALMAQKYVDEGGDFEHIDDALENYDGNDAKKLADMYLLRLLHDRHCDDDNDKEYIATGITRKMRIFHTIKCCGKEFTSDEWHEYCRETRIDSSKRIITTIGKYDFNDFDICLNPSTLSLIVSHGATGYEVMLKWCDCGNGLWTYGLNYSCGSGGGGFGCSWVDTQNTANPHMKGYPSEKDCILACCDAAISCIEHMVDKDESKVKRLIEMIKEHKKSIKRPVPIQLELFDF